MRIWLVIIILLIFFCIYYDQYRRIEQERQERERQIEQERQEREEQERERQERERREQARIYQERREKWEREREEQERRERQAREKKETEKRRESLKEELNLLIDILHIPVDYRNRIIPNGDLIQIIQQGDEYDWDRFGFSIIEKYRKNELYKHVEEWEHQTKDGSPDLRYKYNEALAYTWYYLFYFHGIMFGIRFHSDTDMEQCMLKMEQAGATLLGTEWNRYKSKNNMHDSNESTNQNNNANTEPTKITKSRFIALKVKNRYPDLVRVLELDNIDEITDDFVKHHKRYLIMKNHPDRFPEQYKDKQEQITKDIMSALDKLDEIIKDVTEEMKQGGTLKI